MRVYERYAQILDALNRCIEQGKEDVVQHWRDELDKMNQAIPSGSGLDAQPRLDISRSTPERLVFSHCDYHHMNSNGFYDGWSEHEVIVTPSLLFGINVRVTGRDRNDIKDYIESVFTDFLMEEVDG